jgi:hypothetical protein
VGADVTLIINQAAVAELLRSPTGPVVKHLYERGTVVQLAARNTCGYATGRLSKSIGKRFVDGTDPAILVGTDTVPYALYNHDGTPPHAMNEVVNMPGIGFRFIGIHPGTKATKFLVKNLPLAIAA